MFDRPSQLKGQQIASVLLLFLLFTQQIEYCLSAGFFAHALQKTTVAVNILASDESIHVGFPS